MDSFVYKTVVGDAVKFDDGTIVLPLVEVLWRRQEFPVIKRIMLVVV